MRAICFCVVLIVATFWLVSAWAAEARGISLHVGINEVNEAHYGGKFQLKGCHNDAYAMERIASAAGFTSRRVLLDRSATTDAIRTAIQAVADDLVAGDIFLFTIASHGGQILDENADEANRDASDFIDETWLLWDRQWLDDEWHELWRRFKPGVRVLVIADTCFSGDSIRLSGSGAFWLNGQSKDELQTRASGVPLGSRAGEVPTFMPGDIADFVRFRDNEAFVEEFRLAANRAHALRAASKDSPDVDVSGLPETADRTAVSVLLGVPTRKLQSLGTVYRSPARQDLVNLFARHAEAYKKVQDRAELRAAEGENPAASLMLLAAAQDVQPAADGESNGAFTKALVEVWANAGFTGTYRGFIAAITERLRRQFYDQVPNIVTLGNDAPAFEAQRPFTIR